MDDPGKSNSGDPKETFGKGKKNRAGKLKKGRQESSQQHETGPSQPAQAGKGQGEYSQQHETGPPQPAQAGKGKLKKGRGESSQRHETGPSQPAQAGKEKHGKGQGESSQQHETGPSQPAQAGKGKFKKGRGKPFEEYEMGTTSAPAGKGQSQQGGAWPELQSSSSAPSQGSWGQPRTTPTQSTPFQKEQTQQRTAWPQLQPTSGAPKQGAWGQPLTIPPQSTPFPKVPVKAAEGGRGEAPSQQFHTPSVSQGKGSQKLKQDARGFSDLKEVPQQQHSDITKASSEDKNLYKRVSAVTAKMASSTLSEGMRTRPLDVVPLRASKKGPKTGEKMLIEVNYFPIKMENPNLIAYQYDVEITPDKPKSFMRTVWNRFWKRNFPDRNPSFDGSKIAVSAQPLIQTDRLMDSFELVMENGKTKEFKIEIALGSKVNLKNLWEFLSNKNVSFQVPSAELAVLDIVLRNNASNCLVRAGRNFFNKPGGQIISLGEGLEVWYGYYQSAVLGWKLYLNFDVAHKGFPITDIIKAAEEVCFGTGRGVHTTIDKTTILRDYDLEKLEKFLKNLKVEYKLPNDPGSKRIYRINGLRKVPACKEFFDLDQGDKKTEQIDVVRYYKTQRNYTVKYPNLPALWVGSVNSKIYVPMELCSIIPGQVRNQKLTDHQTSNMIKAAADPPPSRKRKIMEQLSNAQLRNTFTNEFGISVASEFEKVEARVLDPPKLQSEKPIQVRRGQWDVDKLLDAKPLKNWCILNLNPERIGKHLELSLEQGIVDRARRMGMDAREPIQHCISCNPRQIQNVCKLFQNFKDREVSLVFVIVPDKGSLYSDIKKISEIDVGVLTQCLKANTVLNLFSGRPNASTLSNILLKVNAKLNGINHSLHELSLPQCFRNITMIVGADVTHPSPDATNIPSIVAVAASYDAKATKYNTIRKIQASKCEVILDFENIMKEQLLYFYRQTRYKPERIIMFRDGVSEGQVDIILKEELMALRRACSAMQAPDNKDDYQPPITFIIVQKNHHTRFFPLQTDRNFNERNPNVPPGTCVDSDIVHPRELDFYLVSHASRLGTSRPTKYKLLYDDSTMTEQELQTLSYYLCHLLSRCSKSISYPAPTYYAHLAALRARIHLLADQRVKRTTGAGSDEKKIKVCDYFNNNPMFFV